MGTQGLVTVKSGEKVLMKVVAGCDGFNAERFASRLKRVWPIKAEDVYNMASVYSFGEKSCLVVITDFEIYHRKPKGSERISPLYRKTFQDPLFNPRWKHGTADHVVVINI
jgi:hypothetical protein